jgi:hypothetical protein
VGFETSYFHATTSPRFAWILSAAWKRETQVSLLNENRRPSRIADSGLSISDVVAALGVISEDHEIRDKRILGLSLHHSGVLFVKTGESIGGYEVALRKSDDRWQIVESDQWIA